jgi:hypothetical protein
MTSGPESIARVGAAYFAWNNRDIGRLISGPGERSLLGRSPYKEGWDGGCHGGVDAALPDDGSEFLHGHRYQRKKFSVAARHGQLGALSTLWTSTLVETSGRVDARKYREPGVAAIAFRPLATNSAALPGTEIRLRRWRGVRVAIPPFAPEQGSAPKAPVSQLGLSFFSLRTRFSRDLVDRASRRRCWRALLIHSGPPRRQLEKYATTEPVGVKLAGLRKVDDLQRDELGYGVADPFELQDAADTIKRRAHRLDVRGVHYVFCEWHEGGPSTRTGPNQSDDAIPLP